MYSISQTALAALRAHAKQTMTIECTPTKGSSFEITDSDMVGAPTISYASVSGDKIEIGSAIAAELSFTLNNWDGKFDDKIFEGAELYVEIKVPSVNYTVPMGYFTVDNTPRKLTTIKITAYDRMARFDRPYDTQLSYPATLYGIIDDACTKCGVTCGVPTSALNAKNSVPNKPEADNLTYRQVIMWAAQLMGMNLYIDRGGTLMAKWYTSSSNHQYIEPSDRFMSGNTDYAENSVTVTGVRIVCNDEAKTEYIAGTTAYAFNIEGNLLAQEGMSLQTIATYIYKSRSITYRPMSCQTHSFPHLMPLDIINFRTASGDSYPTILTNVTHTLNQNSKLEGKGKTAAQAGHATLGAFTSRQQAILEQTKNQTYATISGMQQAVLKLNETMANSMGLYVTTIGDGSGGTITYYHNEPYLENSSTIYCKNAGGYAWTNTGWNSGNPIWHYGVSKDGDAVMRSIATYKLIADYITAGAINGHDGKFSINLDTGKIIASDISITGGNISMDGGTLRSFSQGFGVDLSPGYIDLYYNTNSAFSTGAKFMQLCSSALIYAGSSGDYYATLAAPAIKGFRLGSSRNNVSYGSAQTFWNTDYMLVEKDALRVRQRIKTNERLGSILDGYTHYRSYSLDDGTVLQWGVSVSAAVLSEVPTAALRVTDTSGNTEYARLDIFSSADDRADMRLRNNKNSYKITCKEDGIYLWTSTLGTKKLAFVEE